MVYSVLFPERKLYKPALNAFRACEHDVCTFPSSDKDITGCKACGIFEKAAWGKCVDMQRKSTIEYELQFSLVGKAIPVSVILLYTVCLIMTIILQREGGKE